MYIRIFFQILSNENLNLWSFNYVASFYLRNFDFSYWVISLRFRLSSIKYLLSYIIFFFIFYFINIFLIYRFLAFARSLDTSSSSLQCLLSLFKLRYHLNMFHIKYHLHHFFETFKSLNRMTTNVKVKINNHVYRERPLIDTTEYDEPRDGIYKIIKNMIFFIIKIEI